jgi:hypothetical protein
MSFDIFNEFSSFESFYCCEKVLSKELELYLEANKFPPSGDEPSAQTKMECSNL